MRKNVLQKPCLGVCEVHYVYVRVLCADVRVHTFFRINVSANTVFSLEPFHRLGYITLASVLHNQICRLLSIIKPLVVFSCHLFELPTLRLSSS